MPRWSRSKDLLVKRLQRGGGTDRAQRENTSDVVPTAAADVADVAAGEHSRQTPLTQSPPAPPCTSAAVLGSSSPDPGMPSPSPAWSSTKLSSMIASLRRISSNLTVWPIPFPRRRAYLLHPGPE